MSSDSDITCFDWQDLIHPIGASMGVSHDGLDRDRIREN